MSLERVLKTLESFGLSRTESEVYVYLAKAGPSRVKDLSDAMGMTKQQLYSTLMTLRKKGIVTSKPERAALFSAIALKELVRQYMDLNVEKAEVIRKTKQELLNSWRKMSTTNNA